MKQVKLIWTAEEIEEWQRDNCYELNCCQDCDEDFCKKQFLDADEVKRIIEEEIINHDDILSIYCKRLLKRLFK